MSKAPRPFLVIPTRAMATSHRRSRRRIVLLPRRRPLRCPFPNQRPVSTRRSGSAAVRGLSGRKGRVPSTGGGCSVPPHGPSPTADGLLLRAQRSAAHHVLSLASFKESGAFAAGPAREWPPQWAIVRPLRGVCVQTLAAASLWTVVRRSAETPVAHFNGLNRFH